MAKRSAKSGASPSTPTPRPKRSSRTVPKAAQTKLPAMTKKPPFMELGVPGPTKKTRRMA